MRTEEDSSSPGRQGLKMATLYSAVLLLLIANVGNYCVKGQSTTEDYNSNDEGIVKVLQELFKDFHAQRNDVWTMNIQAEFQNLKAQISRLEDRVGYRDTYLSNSIDEIKNQLQKATNDTKASISSLENGIERHNILLYNSIQEYKRQVQTANTDTEVQLSRVENRVEHHDTLMNNLLQDQKRQMQTANNDTKMQLSRLEHSAESHDTLMNNLLQDQKRQMQTANIDTKMQLSSLENRFQRHDTLMNSSLKAIQGQMQSENREMKSEFQGLNLKLSRRECPTGFDYGVAGLPKCYAVLNDRVNWDTAQQRCRRLNTNAQLAVIINRIEMQITTEILRNHDCLTQNPFLDGSLYRTNEFWIGARRRNVSDCSSPFEWTSNSGAMFSLQYSNWGPTEPNCYEQREGCASINKNIHSKWNDLPCSSSACPLCEVTIRT